MKGQRGRQGQKVQLVPHDRPKPPADLGVDQASVWRETVNRLPPDWFPAETWPLLAQYCRHAVSAKRLGEEIEVAEATKADPKDRDLLLKMHDREGRAMSSLATRMRLSQQSSYDAKKGKGGKTGSGPKPWEQGEAV